MRPMRTVSILLTLFTLAGCASTRNVEEEPADPTELGELAAPDESPASGEGGTTFQGLSLKDDGGSTPPAGATTGDVVCTDGRAPLSVKLLVLLRHPTDPVPALPADGFSVSIDGKPAVTGARVGQVHTLCVAPGEHDVVVRGGTLTRAIKASAPGAAHLPVAGGGSGPVPGLPPGTTTPLPAGRP